VSERFDVAVIGAGMAGASLAAELAPHARVLILEAEDQPGYHATGRSAAFWSETYGGPWVQPLTSASGPFLAAPDPRFSDRPLMTRRGALHIADSRGGAALDRLLADFSETDVELRPLPGIELIERLPWLRPGWQRAVMEPSCADIDVAGLHAAYLRHARAAGAELVLESGVTGLAKGPGGWRLETGSGTYQASILANAAGAWADSLAVLAGVRPIGIRPYRRTMLQVVVEPPAADDLPLVIDARERFYFKPEAGGKLWLSPHDETPCDPCDTAPEEVDAGLAVARLQQATTLSIRRVERRWAGLRSFAPDRRPVYGFAADLPGFFWCAGQGGFGIQTAPAAARLAAAMLLGIAPHASVAPIDPAAYAPARLLN